MTEDDTALVKAIRKEVCNCHICGLCGWKPKRAADRIEALSAENERLIKSGDGDVGLIHWQGERIEKLEAALREIARLRTDLSGDFSLGSKQSDIARAALGETE